MLDDTQPERFRAQPIAVRGAPAATPDATGTVARPVGDGAR
ncbi:hypothetical protein [Alkalisalibacterium limincola]|nr:hypothetical protein [Alkalisalibacterium limincola]